MSKHWYEANTGNHQGLVVEEETGKNIAVTYDKQDAALCAAAPELLEALKAALVDYEDLVIDGEMEDWRSESIYRFKAVVAKAEGREL